MCPVTNTITPPDTEGWKSVVDGVTLHPANGSAPSFCPIACGPWYLSPMNVSIDASWYRLTRAGRLDSNMP